MTKRTFCALQCLSMFRCEHRSIFLLQYRPMAKLDGHLGCLLQISLKCSKIITYLQITPNLINIINRLNNIIVDSKTTYKPWIKMGQIYGLSIFPDLPFCLSSSKTNMQSLWKKFRNSRDSHNLKLESSPLQYCNPHLRGPNHKSTSYHILA